ncbi:divalent metal cation transporter (plasmid) [Bartonella sp. HY329]|uniref:NRAMP family divalent metal transporter n=1 Tax=unclassified Bartonella TaxID=2645622 RepID=UPI0021C5AC1E|nr:MULTISPECIES: NRAMP family divalent metal transporter [unclassified Bartonella]UXM96619.1 divalent metal cation transporter [Bartonella sp. HY329]UXN10942.1 divalent metal cation transporter [Bartonella sp. HY328]
MAQDSAPEKIETLKSKAVRHSTRGSLLAAIFMMATSAIGPGFITQTATFTEQMGAAFAFAILASILVDFVVQLNVWRIVALTRKRASDIANLALPGSGYVLAALVIFGGLVFNIGNIAGAGLGMNAMLGLDPKIGGAISAILAILLFSTKKLGTTVDRVMILFGLLMIAMTIYMAFSSHPPVGEALKQTVWPSHINFATITTIIGGTVGGYITYAGAHRLLDRGTVGKENLPAITKGALSGIFITGVMRYILFLGILGVVTAGGVLTSVGTIDNPAGRAFQIALGEIGLRLFGLIFWAAAITSIIGAAYTSVTFMSAFYKDLDKNGQGPATIIFIVIGLIAYELLGTTPAALLVFAGGFNGLILPIGLTIFIYVGFFRSDLMEGYKYSRPFLIISALTCLLTWYMGALAFSKIFELLLS